MPNHFTQSSYQGSEKITECKKFEVGSPGGRFVGEFGVFIIDTPHKQFVVIRNQPSKPETQATTVLSDLANQLRQDASFIKDDAIYMVFYPSQITDGDELIHELPYSNGAFSQNGEPWLTPTGMSTQLTKQGFPVSVPALTFN